DGGMAKALPLIEQCRLENRQIVVHAECFTQGVRRVSAYPESIGPQGLKNTGVMPVILHVLSPLVEVLGGRRLVCQRHRLAGAAIGLLEPAAPRLRTGGVDRPVGHAFAPRFEPTADLCDAFVDLRHALASLLSAPGE